MGLELPVPSVSEPCERLADWMECCTLAKASRSFSYYELRASLDVSSTLDSVEDGGRTPSDEVYESYAEDVFGELDDRSRACGGPGGRYPFELTDNTLALRAEEENGIYVFLFLLSRFGKNAGPSGAHPERMFERLSAHALEAYLGGRNVLVNARRFGFPRAGDATGFRDALHNLCSDMGEGGTFRKDRPDLSDQKDAKLDVVAWRAFDDRRIGKLIVFGQCATGDNWRDKLTELHCTDSWCSYWMTERPAVLPLRAFFVPHRIDRKHWAISSFRGGVFFDRCRIAGLAPATVDAGLTDECARWTREVLTAMRKP